MITPPLTTRHVMAGAFMIFFIRSTYYLHPGGLTRDLLQLQCRHDSFFRQHALYDASRSSIRTFASSIKVRRFCPWGTEASCRSELGR